MKITNEAGIGLPLAVWIMHDEYDYITDVENYISVTTLMRPLRQIVLPLRIPYEQRQADVQDFIASALGKSLHDSIEKAWVKGYAVNLKKLGYPDDVISKVRINPNPSELVSGDLIPVYLEQRHMKTFQGFTIGGKFDMVAEGVVYDNKSTSAFSWLYGTRDDEHRLQMSLYRWLCPEIITEDYGVVNYIFTDWSKMQAKVNPKYPQKRVEQKTITLMPLDEVEQWVSQKLKQINTHFHTPETQLPHCTDEELWRSDPQYKYYSDPAKTDGRATRNFDSLAEANRFMAEKGKGIVITKLGEPKRCSYCQGFDICTQKDAYL